MSRCNSHGGLSLGRYVLLLLAITGTIVLISCGPEDYQQPVKTFQDASQVVITSTRDFLTHENTVEENAVIDTYVFDQKPFDQNILADADVISPDEIRIRTAALDALAKYTANLAHLASGKFASDVGQDTKTLSDSLTKLSNDAKNIPATKNTILDNKKFSGVASAAASAIGAVAQLMIERKARHELEEEVEKNDVAVQTLLDLIGTDAQLAYQRQRATLSAYGVQLYASYKKSLDKKDRDPIVLLQVADRVKSFRNQESVLQAADPTQAIANMKKAHVALVSYVKSDKNPHSLSELIKSVQDFSAAAEPLGSSVQLLVSAAK